MPSSEQLHGMYLDICHVYFADFDVVSARLQSSAQHALLTCNKPTLTFLSYSLLPLVSFFLKTFYVLLIFSFSTFC